MIRLVQWIRRRRVAREATRRFVAVHRGGVSLNELKQHAEWLSSRAAHNEAYAQIDDVWHGMEALRDDFALATVRTARARASLRSAWAVAGAAAAIASVAMLWVSHRVFPDAVPFVLGGPERHVTAVAAIGEFYLPDRSRLTLGAKSELVIRDFGEERRVALKGGEAFFEVTRDERRPFVIDAGNAVIRVLGTKFNVHTGPEGVRVTVAEGTVAVTADTAASVGDPAERRVVLAAGESVLVDTSGALSAVTARNVADVTSWRDGLLSYTETPLAAVAADLNRYSRDTLIIEDAELGRVPITGLFRAGELASVVRELSAILPVEVLERRPGEFSVRRLRPALGADRTETAAEISGVASSDRVAADR